MSNDDRATTERTNETAQVLHPEHSEHPEHTASAAQTAEREQPKKSGEKADNDEETQQFVATIASWLEETEATPIWYIRNIVKKAGSEQTMALLKEVLEIEKQGGMLVEDKSRRRTIGGIFFYLAKQKGYLKLKFYPKKIHKHQRADEAMGPDQNGQNAPTQLAWSWDDRIAEIAELRTAHIAQGATNVKITLIGRPGRIANHGTFIITTMQSSKAPALPKGLPVPPQASTTYAVYIAARQWKKVEESLRNPEDILIAEGYPMLDSKTGTITVFVTSTATKLLQAAQREQQKAKAQG